MRRRSADAGILAFALIVVLVVTALLVAAVIAAPWSLPATLAVLAVIFALNSVGVGTLLYLAPEPKPEEYRREFNVADRTPD